MKNLYYLLIVLLLIPAYLKPQGSVLKTQPLSSEIHSIEVLANKDWNSYPIIGLNSGDYIHIGFDKVSEDTNSRFFYRITHCNADWTKDNLSEIEYLDGFNDNPIEDYRTSINTTVNYTHYNLQLPNEDVSLKLPGNYVVEVYDDEENIVLTACFSVLDNQVNIGAEVSSVTDIDSNNKHHQLSFDLNHKMNLRDTKNDFMVFVRQNNRLDNQRSTSTLTPSHIMPTKLRYTHSKNLIFEAGNEYQRFDMSSYKHNGKNVARIEYKRPHYYMHIVPNKIKATGAYSYDQDQNGRSIFRDTDHENVEIEGDYFFVNLTLHADSPLPKDIFVNGAFSYNSFSEKYKMKYDDANKEYHLTLLLKQGIYNYQYLTSSRDSNSLSDIDGNYYETENEYTIYVYYRPIGKNYDSLVGFTRLQSRTK